MWAVLTCLLSSCAPESLFDNWERTIVTQGEPLRGIYFISQDTGLVWGGMKNQSGFIKKTTDGGFSWIDVWRSNSKCIYTLGFSSTGKGIAGGDSLFMLHSHDRGNTWFFYWLADSVPMHSFNRPAFRYFAEASNRLFLTAGEYFKKGVFYSSHDDGKTWSYSFYPNEMSRMAFLNDSIGLVAGNGLLLSLHANKGFEPQILPFQGDFWTDVTPWKNGFLVASRSSSIYFFNPSSNSLQKIKRARFLPGDTPALNSIIVDQETIIAGGDQGYFCWSTQNEAIWEESYLPESTDIQQIAIKKGFILFVTSGGIIYRLPLQLIKPHK